jgi:hypothetical protein
MPECFPRLRTYCILQYDSKFVNTNSHLAGRLVLTQITSSPNSQFCLGTGKVLPIRYLKDYKQMNRRQAVIDL